MIYYIFPYFFIVFMSLLSLKIKGNGYKYLFFLGLIPATFVVVLRGVVGTDTETYISILEQNIHAIDINERGIEPFFLAFAKLKHFFNLSAQLVLNFFSFIIILVLFSFFSIKKNRFIIFSALIFPIFFYDMTMNGVRYGMAFAFACFFIAELGDKTYKINKNKFLFILAFLNHKSSVLFLAIKLMQKVSVRNFLIILIFAFSIIFFLKDYLVYKFTDYSDFSSPSIFSGLQPLILTALVLGCNSIFVRTNIKRNFYLLTIQIFFYIITQFSYAGIRFQFLELFYIIIVLAEDENVSNYKFYCFLLFFIGFIGFCLKMNNFIDEAGGRGSTFLPYLFFWEK